MGGSTGSWIKIILGLVLVAVGFVIFPIVLTGAEESRLATNVSEYTGLSSMIEVGPTLVFVGFLFGGVVAMFFGIKGLKDNQ